MAPTTASWLPKMACELFWDGATISKQALKPATSSRDSESCFSGHLEPLLVLRHQMDSLRSLQNECIVFVPPGAGRQSAVWFEAIVLDQAVLGSQEAVFGAVFLDYIKRVRALLASLDYKSQPTTGKSPEESSYGQHLGRVIVSVIAKSKTKEHVYSLVQTVWVYAAI